MASLEPQTTIDYPRLALGTVESLAQTLHQELYGGGYSLLESDVLSAFLCEVQFYSAWAAFAVQKAEAATVTLLNKDLVLDSYEWAIIEPVVRAHCDLLQARLVEGSRSLGGDGFGLQVSEAQQNYLQARELLPKTAFVAQPYTLGKL
jgi:hypothetical protein